MSALDDLFTSVTSQFVTRLPEAAVHRVAALAAARGIMPQADASDRMILANFILTGFEIIPEPKDDPYPHLSGDTVVLGPGIFSNTVMGPAENSVINWQGMNFVPQHDSVDEGWHVELGGQRFTQAQWEVMLTWRTGTDMPLTEHEHPDDPGPEEPSGELHFDPELHIDPDTPAPMAGTHWQGRRGGQPG